jgi:hypothetical protein
LVIIPPTGEPLDESDFQTAQPISISIPLDYKEKDFKDNYVGTWRVVVEAGDCGDDFSRFNFRSTPDTGNDVSLEVQYSYYMKVES